MRISKSEKARKVLAHEYVARHLRAMLGGEEMPPHTPFLSEVKLAKKFNVNAATARKAVDRLVHEGMLYKLHRKGTFVAPKPKNRLLLMVTTNPDSSFVGKLTPVADQYPDLQWQELSISSIRSHMEDIERVFPFLEGVLFVRDLPRCSDVIRELQKKKIPTLFYGSDVHFPSLKGCHSLLYKEGLVTTLALNHLKDRGCKRIACVGKSGWAATDARVEHYIEWVKDNKFPDDPNLMLNQQEKSDSLSRYSFFYERFRASSFKADGMFCLDEGTAAVVTQAALAAGRKIPSDLALVGVEDDEAIAHLVFPQTTNVRIPLSEDIQEAFHFLSNLSTSTDEKESAHHWSKPYLIKRQST